MTTEAIKQTELTQSERDVLVDDRKRWRSMGAGAHLDEWLAYYPGFDIRRRLAMRIAHTNQPIGKNYAVAFAQLMKDDSLDTMDKTSVSAVLWLRDDPEHERILREIRQTMTPGQRSRLNSPISARQRVERVVKVREAARAARDTGAPSEAGAPKKETVKDNLLRELEELRGKCETMKNSGGSLFDLQDTPVATIARDIAEELTNSGRFSKFVALQAALAKEIATRKAALKNKAQAG
jgi:hypothetical protein